MRGDRALEAILSPRERPAPARLRAAAVFTLVPALILGALGFRLLTTTPSGPEAAVWLAVLLAAMFVTLPALGVLQADIRCNPELETRSRARWLTALLVLPSAAFLYWLRHRGAVRESRHALDKRT